MDDSKKKIVMVDWITCVIPCTHSSTIFGGKIFKIQPDGEIVWTRDTAKQITGSYDSNIQVQTSVPGESLHVSGNPVKFLQGHNLFGSNDLVSLNYALLENLREILDLRPSELELAAWAVGGYPLSRIDLATMFNLGSPANVRNWLRQAEQTATMSHRGRGQLTKGSTLYFGKNSRRWGAKFYAKGEEFHKNGHDALLEDARLVDYASPMLRYEVVTRTMELKRLGLDSAFSWEDFDKISNGIIDSTLERFNMGNVTALAIEQIDGLKPSLRGVLELWRTGYDVRGILPKTSFYRYRSQIMAVTGVDIATPKPSKNEGGPAWSDLVQPPIELVPAQIPDWAIGTPLYFEPKKPLRLVGGD